MCKHIVIIYFVNEPVGSFMKKNKSYCFENKMFLLLQLLFRRERILKLS